jgi:hypothetical protein
LITNGDGGATRNCQGNCTKLLCRMRIFREADYAAVLQV